MEQDNSIIYTEAAELGKRTTSPSRKETTHSDTGAIMHGSNCDCITPIQAKSEGIAIAKDTRTE